MKTIIETEGYPVRVALVPETEADRRVLKELKFHFCEDENSDTEASCDDVDDIEDYGQDHLVFTAWCNLN